MKHLYLLWLFLCVGLLWCNSTMAQKAVISGTVTDENKEPLPGVTVKVENPSVGALTGSTTDLDGNYSIGSLDKGSYVVTYSFVGFQSVVQNISLVQGESRTINISLAEDNKILNEVVVVGYGVQRKRDLVGSISKVESKDITPVVGASFETALQGKAAGVTITQNSGAAGSGSVVRIRGISSISSGGDPLYVVDGIPITQDYFLGKENYGANNNPLNSLNPGDIESVEVLKDAAAAAIYGSRGANGVIIITTKRGKNGKPRFNFSTRLGMSKPTNIVEFLGTEDWIAMAQEGWENDGNVGKVPLPLGISYEQALQTHTNWIDMMIQDGMKQEYNLSMTQGADKLKTYIGLGYSDGESYLVGNSFQRISGRLNLDYTPTEKLQLSLSSSLARGLNRRVAEAWAGGLGTAQSTALPFYPVYNSDGTFFNLYNNPVAQNQLQRLRNLEWRSINNLSVKYNITDRWNINLSGMIDYMDLNQQIHEDALWTTTRDIAKNEQSKIYNWSSFATTNYDVPIKSDKHTLKVLLGLEYQQKTGNGNKVEYAGLSDFIFLNPGNDGQPIDTISKSAYSLEKWRFASAFTRINYAFMNKWLFQAVWRRDASSRFGTNKRFGDFPSVGVGYLLSEEPFLKNNKTINFLKLKASFGVTGNADIDWASQWARFTYGQSGDQNLYNGDPIRYQYKIANPNLGWEKVRTIDGGFELGLWNDRLTTDFTYYNKRTYDAIIKTSISASSGLESLDFPLNIGVIENKGIELGLTTRNIVGKFQWTTRLNMAHNKNRVIEVGAATPDALDGGFGDTRAVPGYAANTNYLVVFSHINPETGRPVYLDKDGNETDTYDVAFARKPAKDPNPWLVGGLSNTFQYKGFDLSILFNFSLGGLVYDDAAKRQRAILSDWNMRKDLLDRWREPGDVDAAYPKLTFNTTNWGLTGNIWQNNNTLWLEEASFARLRTLELGYTYKPTKGRFSSIRLALVGTNLLTFTNYTGWDPEVARGRENPQQRNVGGSNVTYLVPPQEKSYNIALTVDF